MRVAKPTLLLVLIVMVFATTHSASHAQEGARTIEVHLKRFAFSPSEITLNKGETAKLMLISDDVPHSLVIRDLKVNALVTKDHPGEVTITPTTAGDFRGACGRFCGSGHGSMKFTVHVLDSKP
jgi:cytochrome c oxidase subunit 2